MPGNLAARASMPVLSKGQTSLRVLARMGLTNFQLLQLLMAFVFLLHAADGAMLPAVFKALEEGLGGATPVSLGVIVTVEALCHSLAVFAWGVMADRCCKLYLLQQATLSWGLLTLATAFVRGVGSLAVIRALAGIVGAALGPLSQGLIGAVCPVDERGRAFGFLIACGQAGHIFGLLLAGATSHLDAIGGWRGSFALFAVFTLMLSWVLSLVRMEVSAGFFAESRTWQKLGVRSTAPRSTGIFTEVAGNFCQILRCGSFQVLLLQGAFASTTLKAMQYQLMWYQYLGFSDIAASAMTSAASLGCIGGAVCSGYLSDWLSRLFPNHGRIAMGQTSDFVKLLILVFIFIGFRTPDAGSKSTVVILTCASLLFGFTSIMAYSSVVKPLFAEIVPPHMIAQVIGVAAAIDGAFSSFASAPVVGFITQKVFHYHQTTLPVNEMPEALRASNAAALGNSIAAVTTVSSLLTILFFGLLHCTYPKDREASLDAEECPDGDEAFLTGSAQEAGERIGSGRGRSDSSSRSRSNSSHGSHGSHGSAAAGVLPTRKCVHFQTPYGSTA